MSEKIQSRVAIINDKKDNFELQVYNKPINCMELYYAAEITKEKVETFFLDPICSSIELIKFLRQIYQELKTPNVTSNQPN